MERHIDRTVHTRTQAYWRSQSHGRQSSKDCSRVRQFGKLIPRCQESAAVQYEVPESSQEIRSSETFLGWSLATIHRGKRLNSLMLRDLRRFLVLDAANRTLLGWHLSWWFATSFLTMVSTEGLGHTTWRSMDVDLAEYDIFFTQGTQANDNGAVYWFLQSLRFLLLLQSPLEMETDISIVTQIKHYRA